MEPDVLQLLTRGHRDAAFEAILKGYEAKVYRLAYSLLGDEARSKDATQEAFLKIWQGLELFDPQRAALGTWVYAISRNVALSRLRADAYRMTVPLESVAEPAAQAEPAYGDLRRAVQRLPEELREAVVLYYYQERAVDEVAMMLDLPVGTVKSHLFRARKMLAEFLEGVAR